MQRVERFVQSDPPSTAVRAAALRIAFVVLSAAVAGNALAAESMPRGLAVPAFLAGLAAASMAHGVVRFVMLRDATHRSFALAALGLAVAFGAPFVAPLAEYAAALSVAGFALAGLFVARLLPALFDVSGQRGRALRAAALPFAIALVAAPTLPAAAVGAATLVFLGVAIEQRLSARLHARLRSKSDALAGAEQRVETLEAAEARLARMLAQRGEQLDSLARRLHETEQRRLHATHHDPLTGLANPLLLADRITQGITRSKRHNCRVAVAVVDLDDFAAVNDLHGRDVGDLVLKSVGTRLCGIVRAQDTVARIGNDAFAVVLEEVFDPLDVQRVENAIAAELGQSFEVNGRAVSIAASIGFAMFPDGGTDAAGLLRSADKLMRRAKRGKAMSCASDAANPVAA